MLVPRIVPTFRKANNGTYKGEHKRENNIREWRGIRRGEEEREIKVEGKREQEEMGHGLIELAQDPTAQVTRHG
jgi:hypothetical protein